MAGLLNKNSRY